jgi:integrase
MFGLAARHDAVTCHPVRDAARICASSDSARALDLAEVADLRARIATDQHALDWDLVDFVDMVIATGLRIGETAAVTRPAVDLDAGTVEVRGTVIRVRGVGLVIRWKPKSARRRGGQESGWRAVELPTWCVRMLQARHERYVPNEWDVVLTSPTGCVIRATRRPTYGTCSSVRAIRTSRHTRSVARSPP